MPCRPGPCALLVAALLAGCWGSDGKVGELVAVFTQQAAVDGQTAGGGAPLEPGATLGTDATGSARFRIFAPVLDCHLLSASTVEVKPGGGEAFELRAGEVVCDQRGGSPAAIRIGGTTTELADAAVAIEYRDDRATTKSLRGDVSFGPEGGNEAVTVEAGKQATSAEGGAPAPPRAFDYDQLPPAQREAALDLDPDILASSGHSPTTGTGPAPTSTTTTPTPTPATAGDRTVTSQVRIRPPPAP
ncbi:MAG TPA: hypothetical protein VNT56_11685 [Acidimicrobiales bacterium]|nr:hypothetical protein [Acidimicrobiales bacterium]